jgi:hypothetical protein
MFEFCLVTCLIGVSRSVPPDAVHAYAKAETKRPGTARRRASARTRAELAPLTGEQDGAAESRLILAAVARDLIGPGSDELPRRHARTHPLGGRPKYAGNRQRTRQAGPAVAGSRSAAPSSMYLRSSHRRTATATFAAIVGMLFLAML